MKRLRHLPIVWGPTPSRVATTALLGSRSQASTIFARNVSAAGSERDRVMAKTRPRYGQKMRAFVAGHREYRLRASGSHRASPSIRIPETDAIIMLRTYGTEHCLSNGMGLRHRYFSS